MHLTRRSLIATSLTLLPGGRAVAQAQEVEGPRLPAFDIGMMGFPQLSPDASMVVGVASSRELIWCSTADMSMHTMVLDLGGVGEIEPESIVWRPDSSCIAFSSTSSGTSFDGRIWMLSLPGGDLSLVFGDEPGTTRGEDEPRIDHARPFWSPDGTRLFATRSETRTIGGTITLVEYLPENDERGEFAAVLDGVPTYFPWFLTATSNDEIIFAAQYVDTLGPVLYTVTRGGMPEPFIPGQERPKPLDDWGDTGVLEVSFHPSGARAVVEFLHRDEPMRSMILMAERENAMGWVAIEEKLKRNTYGQQIRLIGTPVFSADPTRNALLYCAEVEEANSPFPHYELRIFASNANRTVGIIPDYARAIQWQPGGALVETREELVLVSPELLGD